jgi:hypothetical protein
MPKPLGFAVLLAIVVQVACSSGDMVSPHPSSDFEPAGALQYPAYEESPSAISTQSITYSQLASNIQPAATAVEKVGGSAVGDAELPAVTLVRSQSPTPVLLSDAPEATKAAEVPTRSRGGRQVIGTSFEGRPITSYHFGHGPQTVIFVGGIHGGYEWNTIMLAYQAIDYFLANPSAVPQHVSLVIIPSANPDGLFGVTGKEGRFDVGDLAFDTTTGRFNGRGVDLNRNWDCSWSPSALWRDQTVSGGESPFSEPESQALRDYFLELRPSIVIFWHSSADGIYGAGCPELFQLTRELAGVYGAASGYPVADQFTHYEISGDAGDWLSTQGIPSITVELASHDLVEWPENLAGMLALLDYTNRLELELQIPE